MSANIVTAIYIAASVLFILSLGGLSNQESAKRAVWYGIVGMALAVGATIFGPQVAISNILILMIVIGSVIGLVVARRVEMTGMPQLVAALHTFVGMAAVFIGINSELAPPAGLIGAEKIIHEVEVFLGVFIGAVTTTGSIVAFGKLAGILDGKPLTLPARNLLNLIAVLVCVWLGYMYLNHAGIWTLYLMTAIALVFGAHLVLAIGGADPPVAAALVVGEEGVLVAAHAVADEIVRRGQHVDRRLLVLVRVGVLGDAVAHAALQHAARAVVGDAAEAAAAKRRADERIFLDEVAHLVAVLDID